MPATLNLPQDPGLIAVQFLETPKKASFLPVANTAPTSYSVPFNNYNDSDFGVREEEKRVKEGGEREREKKY